MSDPFRLVRSLLALGLLAAVVPAQDGSTPIESGDDLRPQFAWIDGPATGELGAWAQVGVPESYRFLGPSDTRRIMELMGNPTSGQEVGFLGPSESDWFAVFEFDDSGYVKDDEKAELDADEILASIKEGTEASNLERQRRGWPTLETLGWVTPPHYDEATHNLEWSTRARASDGQMVVNHNTRLLGRSGVMSVTLVCDPEQLDEALPLYRSHLSGFAFKQGQRYTEFKSGDKLAEYGLTALIAGGAGAVAAKTGLLAKFWKLLVAAGIAVVAFLKKLFGRGKSTPASPAKKALPVAESVPVEPPPEPREPPQPH